MYADALHACELCQGAFSKMGGRYYEDEIYNVDEKCVKEFDRQFSNKEIIYGTPMQKKFEMMIERVKPYQE